MVVIKYLSGDNERDPGKESELKMARDELMPKKADFLFFGEFSMYRLILVFHHTQYACTLALDSYL